MIFKFGKGKKGLSDVLKVATFLEENDIEYEMLTDINLSVGPTPEVTGSPATPSAPDTSVFTDQELAVPKPTSDEVRARMDEAGVDRIAPVDPASILFRAAQHEDADGNQIICQDRSCKRPEHLGANFNF